jgi:hypothetical protein
MILRNYKSMRKTPRKFEEPSHPGFLTTSSPDSGEINDECCNEERKIQTEKGAQMEKTLALQTTFKFRLGGLATSTMSSPRSTRDNGESYVFTGMTRLVAGTAKQKENDTAARECHWKKRSGSSMRKSESVEERKETETRHHCDARVLLLPNTRWRSFGRI